LAFGLTAACVAKPDSRKRWDVISTMHPLQRALKPMLEMRTPEHVITNSSFHGLKPLHPNCRKGTGSSLSDKIWNARCETLAQHFGTRIKTALREQRRRKIIVALGDTVTTTVAGSIRMKYWAKLEKLCARQSSSRRKDQRCCHSVTRAVWEVIENANCRRAGNHSASNTKLEP